MRRSLAIAVVLATSTAAASPAPRAYPGARAILRDPVTSPYRVHVARMTSVSLVPGGPTTEHGGHQLELDLELPVVEERDGLVRIVIEHDDARTMVWVAEADLAWSVTRPVRLAGRGDSGVWLSTGAPVRTTGKGARRRISHEARGLTLTGTVAADALGRVFPAPIQLEPTWGEPAAELRVAPGGAVLQRGPLPVDVLGVRGAWTEAEFRSPYARVRGWVASDRIAPSLSISGGTGSGSGFAISDVDRVDVPAGVCLFDRMGGEVVGVQLAAARRYVDGREGDWWRVYLGTPWGTMPAWAHALDDGAWETCAPAR